VHEQSREDREWEHWPGRRTPDDGIRHRLRALFTPTDDEAAVEALISERGREIEEQAARLQATIEGLEQREEQAARLRATVEEELRRGSAELDERQAGLAALAEQLRVREERVRALEQEVEARRQELGAVELRRAAVERREEAAAEREEALEAAAADVRVRRRELDDEARELEEARARPAAPPAPQPEPGPSAHVLLVPADGYHLVARDGAPPEPGSQLELDGRAYRVARVGITGVPGDRRPCAFLEGTNAGG
jgi:hypothetical protein